MSTGYGFVSMESDDDEEECNPCASTGHSTSGLQVPLSSQGVQFGFVSTPPSYQSPSNLLSSEAPWAEAAAWY